MLFITRMNQQTEDDFKDLSKLYFQQIIRIGTMSMNLSDNQLREILSCTVVML